jgi:hypothetical protein
MDKKSEPETIVPGEGSTEAERYLAKLCQRSFLSLWSYPAVYRDEGRPSGKGDGKEVCDLLVIFENHIIIFSDKDCEFRNTGRIEVDWPRWFKRAIQKSAVQVYGAESWIKRSPHNLYIDKQCSKPFPISLPSPERAVFHRIVVAHNGSQRCQEALGGSGSLMINSTLTDDKGHFARPFTVGQIDPSRGYVHVFDDTTLNIVMNTLDTISDFTSYLVKKEKLLTGAMRISAAGEEEMLALYLKNLNSNEEHEFIFPGGGKADGVFLAEGLWEGHIASPERRAQLRADKVSYAWDKLIESFTHHAMTGTQYFNSGSTLNRQEHMYRAMAREPRTRRRVLAIAFREVLERSERSKSLREARVIPPWRKGETAYVFMTLRRPESAPEDEYRGKRVQLLWDYCMVTKLKEKAAIVVGIATDAGLGSYRSEDICYLDDSDWGADAVAEAQEIQERLGILKETKLTRSREYEYPVNHEGIPRDNQGPSRNSQCACGSGLRYRKCHGAKFFLKCGKKRDKKKR